MKKQFFLILIFITGLNPLFSESSRSLKQLPPEDEMRISIGRQYLFVIGISDYAKWPFLQNPVKDAKEVRDILKSRYYIDEVFELYNAEATKGNIIRIFSKLQKQLNPDDSLLIFYGGHGYFDEVTGSGFWIPVNAGTDTFNQQNWLPNAQIKGVISRMKASHLCLISDSCFSGDILETRRALPQELNDIPAFRKAYMRTSRQILTSGAFETVPDESEFIYQLKMALLKNNNPYIDPFMIYNEIRLGVTQTSPLIGNLKNAGHQEGGSFILFLKEAQNQTNSFIGKLPPPNKRISNFRDSPNYLQVGTGFHYSFPIESASEILTSSYHQTFFSYYNIVFSPVTLGVGFLSGGSIHKTKPGFPFEYNFITIPLMGSIRIMAGSSLFGYLELSCGASINMKRHTALTEADGSATRFSFSTAVGGGIKIFENINISAITKFSGTLFDDLLYTNLSPGITIAYKL